MKKKIAAICVMLATVMATASVPSMKAQAGAADGKLNYYEGLMEEFETYSGYLDECTKWGGYKDYVNKDYDGDKKKDRVKRTYDKNNQTASYTIEFGNGETLSTYEGFYGLNVPFVEAADLTGDGDPEIIFSAMGLMSTALPCTAVDLRVYTHSSTGNYRSIPVEDTINVYVEKNGKYGLTFSSLSPEFEQKIDIGKEKWEQDADYAYYDKEAVTCYAWDYEIAKSGSKNVMKLYYHIFGKWTPYGMVVTLKYEKGVLHADSSAKAVIDDKDYDRINPNYGY